MKIEKKKRGHILDFTVITLSSPECGKYYRRQTSVRQSFSSSGAYFQGRVTDVIVLAVELGLFRKCSQAM